MKRVHRIPPQAHFVSDPITPEYQTEVDRSAARADRRERDLVRRLNAAETRLAKALLSAAKGEETRALRLAAEQVEARRQDLLDFQREMSTAPSSAIHRGAGHGKQPVPGMRTL